MLSIVCGCEVEVVADAEEFGEGVVRK